MNRRHLQAFVWLRWRIMVNQWRRGGRVNAFLMIAATVAAVVTAVPLFFGTIALGAYAIPEAKPAHLMYAWDVLVAAFLLFWGIGLITELQRSDPLSLSKFLHLPVSADGAFLINYLSSLARLSLVVFGPIMSGFAVALVYDKGPSQLATPLLLAAFLLMVTALTYQFQGWLASLMSNPRRRRTIVVGATMGFILIFQLPNLLSLYAPWGAKPSAKSSTALVAELGKLQEKFQAGEFDAVEHLRRQNEAIEKNRVGRLEETRAGFETFEISARLANVVLPIGWLPFGVMTAAEGRFLPPVLGLLGMTLIGAVSLRRAYGTTVGMYQGKGTSRKARAEVVPVARARGGRGRFMESHVLGLSEPVSAIALGGFRSLLRSPEAKMTLLTPIITSVIFGSMILRSRDSIPELIRPLMASGGMVFVLLGMLQIAGNQFGFDRDGFRVFVLCAARRRDILLGKNLSFAPIALALGGLQLVAVQVLCPMRVSHFLAMFPQFLSMFLMFSVFTNLMSIYTPIQVPAGALRGTGLKFSTAMVQFAMFIILFPLTQGVTLVPLGVEVLLRLSGWVDAAPVCLMLTLLECAALVGLYCLSLRWLGGLLQSREQSILETVTSKGA